MIGPNPVAYLLLNIVSLYKWCVLIYIIMSVLISFNILNIYQPIVNKVYSFLARLVEPILSKIRNFIPIIGGIDISPIFLFISLNFLIYTIQYYF